MIRLEITATKVELIEAADMQTGERVAVVGYLDEASGIVVVVPHSPEMGRRIAAHLDGRPSIQIANGMPPAPDPRL